MDKKEFNKMVGKRIKKQRKQNNMTLKDIAVKLGVTESTVQRYETGNISNVSIEMLQKIGKILLVSPAFLLGWDSAEKVVSDLEAHKHKFLDASISAGYPFTVDGVSSLPLVSIPDVFLGKYATNKNIVVMKVNGDSMNKIIPNGSFIAVKTNIDVLSVSNGDIVVANVDGAENGYTIKHIYKDAINNRVILRPNSTNLAYTDIVITLTDTQRLYIVGKVVAYNVLL
ncbi:DNA-binding helix-turn-helix protein [Megasphaera lornae]|uniref:DNA-binding helix-turn-helix protein n=1 Tax=Megasphaera lornae TaxID=1000568 RepID=D3LUZ2_9FIRM|nr:XRE family transcriptional regulator [Megasphaera genomosp. type_1]EFD93920.1 DNA-binding helix-turn-helix protein [Megasphaera genomosp. type_1 str. 28L]